MSARLGDDFHQAVPQWGSGCLAECLLIVLNGAIAYATGSKNNGLVSMYY